jgi:hypothetical protein
MTLKTLLLGSAAAFAVVGGAQAADLSVAEPVESVKVCDAFAGGYWYIPGTDTCLKIGGLVQFDVNFHDENNQYYGGTHSANWDFVTEAHLNATARSMTDFGELYGFMEFRAVSDNNSYVGGNGPSGKMTAYLDSAYLKLGGLLAGRTGSVYDYGGGFTFDGSDFDSDAAADQLRLSWAAAGFGFALGIEDPRDRFGTQLAAHYSMPNIVAAITASQANWDGQLSAAFAETNAGSGFGAQAAVTIKLDSLAAGDKLRLKAAWAESEVASFASSSISAYSGGSVWSALASFQHFWSPQLSSAVTFDYQNASSPNMSQWEVYGNLVWAPVAGFSAGVEVGWIDAPSTSSADGAWHGKVRLVRSF